MCSDRALPVELNNLKCHASKLSSLLSNPVIKDVTLHNQDDWHLSQPSRQIYHHHQPGLISQLRKQLSIHLLIRNVFNWGKVLTFVLLSFCSECKWRDWRWTRPSLVPQPTLSSWRIWLNRGQRHPLLWTTKWVGESELEYLTRWG